MYSLNIDIKNPKGNPDISELKELGVEMVRYTFYDNSAGDNIDPAAADMYMNKAQKLKEAGIGSLVILTYDTYPGRPDPNAPDEAYNDYIDRFARRSGQIATLMADLNPAFQVWNEPDHPISPNYVPTLSETVYARMQKRTYETIKSVDANMLLVTGGLSQGNPGWLSRVIRIAGGTLHADIVAFHPYGQRPDPNWPDPDWAFGYVGNLITGYYKAGKNKPVWITEMGIKEADLGGNREQCAEFMRRYYARMTSTYVDKVKELMWFCYSDGMVPTFGLKDEALNPKPIYQAFKDAVKARPAPQPAAAPQAATPAKPVQTAQPAAATPATPTPLPGLQPTPLTGTRTSPMPTVTVVPTAMATSATQPASTTADTAAAEEINQLKLEKASLKQQIWRLERTIDELEDKVEQAQAPVPSATPTSSVASATNATPPGTSTSVNKPPMQNISPQLKRNPAKQLLQRAMGQIKDIIIYNTGIPAQYGAERIAVYRVDKQGWPDIGYHFFITEQGQIEQTNDLTTVTPQAGQLNQSSVAVCFAGEFKQAAPSDAQLNAGAQLISWLLKQLNLPASAVSGLKDVVPNQSAPGLQWDNGAKWGNQLRARIQG